MHRKSVCMFMHTHTITHRNPMYKFSHTGLWSTPHMCPHSHTHTPTHGCPHTSCTYTYMWLKSLLFTSCLHHAQLGCERMHFWQEGAGWQDPGRDRSGSPHSVASPGDEILVSNSLPLLLRTSRKTRTIDKATMVCNRI